ncbi:MAG: peptidoglycan-associated lipoprotein Pal [Piscinibacter sp.]|uniref:peptidoglycan-associated lipoprotein Pal n=1 Tax=Piscinibacter sp. TaxID=1903157 RepID=UPI001B49ADBD|nr:peptidoglycan-associated lipoprotein Pal [Piscinibacter sp.]MBP5991234.1 peptidoglycan-associated lipoprotein Pal [Piscinibacter sp.]MBP6026539.1 peptidoglycan-associated lipoprotein Pal [Piscinibacter sp.]
MNRKTLGLSFALASSLLAACSSTPVTPPAAPATPAPAAAPAPKPAAAATPASTVTAVNLPAHLDPNSAISKERSVYFDFDDFSIKPAYTALVERHGKYLAATAGLTAKVEGNADERGSAEYNLALGQKRAEAVVKALKIYGAKDGQLEAVSWGEERPVSSGHDEAAWAQNRRADIVYPKK